MTAVFKDRLLSAINAAGGPSLVLTFGYPFAILLLLTFHSSSYARDMLWLIILVFVWINRRNGRARIMELPHRPTIIAGVLLIVYVTLSVFWSISPTSISPAKHLHNGIGVFLFWLITCWYFQQEKNALKCMYWVLGIGLLANLAGAWFDERDIFSGRLTGYGILNNPILLGSVAVIQIAAGLHLKYRTLPEKMAGFSLLATAITIVLLSGSRGPIMALIAVLMTWFFFTPGIKAASKLAVTIAGLSAVLAGAYYTGLADSLAERGMSYRPLIWKETLRFGQQHGLTGWGWANDFSQSPVSDALRKITDFTFLHPHSLLISAYYYGGAIGLILHVWLLGAVALVAMRTREPGLAISLLAAIILLTATDTYSAVTRRDYIWLIFWMPIAIIITRDYATSAPRRQTLLKSKDQVV